MARKLTRRDFIKIGALSTGGAVLAGCKFPPRYVVLEPYVKPPEEQLAGVFTQYASTCRMCPTGCGLIARTMNGRVIKLEGNPNHPANQGKLCPLGQASIQLLYHPDRLQSPVKQSQRGTRGFQAMTWNEALTTFSQKLASAGNGIGLWAGSSISDHLYNLFNTLIAKTGGQAPILYDLDTATGGSLALAASSQSLMGVNEEPYFDIANADAVFSFGADFLGSYPGLLRYGMAYGQFRNQGLGKRGYLVVFEPKMSLTGAKADLWIPIRAGTEGMVAQAIAWLIDNQNLGPSDWVNRAHTIASDIDINAVAAASDVSVDVLQQVARLFTRNTHPLAIPGGAIGGLDNAAAITAVMTLNAISNSFGQPGGVLPATPLTQQNLKKPVPSSLSDIKKFIAAMNSGQIKVLMIHSANPVYDLPPQLGFVQALAKVPFVISFHPLVDETGVQADLILPDRTPLESWGFNLVNSGVSSVFISSQQPVAPPQFNAPSTGDLLLSAAKGVSAAASSLPWGDEVAYITQVINSLPLANTGISGPDEVMARFQQYGGMALNVAPAAIPSVNITKGPALSAPQYQGDNSYPYHLVIFQNSLIGTGRWASLPWLQGSPYTLTSVMWRTWIEMSPATASQLNLVDGEIIRVSTPNGEVEAPIYTYHGIRPDTIAIPMGQGHTDDGRYARDRGVNPVTLLGAQTDASGNSLVWTTLRAKITSTGRRAQLPLFEYKPGVESGFINQGFPGQ